MTFLTTAQSAAILGVTRCRIRALIKAGRIKAERHGRDWMLREPEVRRFAEVVRKPGRPTSAAKSDAGLKEK